jgi:cellulose synthase/poly-beta-1,6-N-acetylglucosamine synthase-like glycosyltransferase
MTDCRNGPPTWDPAAQPRHPGFTRLLIAAQIGAAAWYFEWLLQPSRIGEVALYTVLVLAELFNLVQACGFWWTATRPRVRECPAPLPGNVSVDVFIPVYGEPLDVVQPTIAAATRLRGAAVNVWVLDDGDAPEVRDAATRHGARYVARRHGQGAKAGNINNALRISTAEFVVVFDCDHVPHTDFLLRTLGYLRDPDVAFVQTPQYYANHTENEVAAAAWAQQSLFFGAIARGKDASGAMFCCGTNVVLRRSTLESVGGFPEESLTEDFELSVRLHQRGSRSVYVPEVLANGLGPTDMGSYVSQQLRWSRGCLSAISSVLRARLSLRLRMQYLLSSMYFLSGWTLLIYMSLPVVRMFTGAQPLATTGADQFLMHFAPYFALSLLIVARAGRGAYSFAGFALAASSWWVHVLSTLRSILRRPGRFVVTPKRPGSSWQPRAVAPSLCAIAVLLSAAGYALSRNASPSTLNNACFAALHITVLSIGAAAALRPRRKTRFADAPANRESVPKDDRQRTTDHEEVLQ